MSKTPHTITTPVLGNSNTTEDPKIASNFATLGAWLNNPQLQDLDIANDAGIDISKIKTDAATTSGSALSSSAATKAVSAGTTVSTTSISTSNPVVDASGSNTVSGTAVSSTNKLVDASASVSGTAISTTNKVVDNASVTPTTVVLGGAVLLTAGAAQSQAVITVASIPTGCVANAKVTLIKIAAGSSVSETLTVQSVNAGTSQITFTSNITTSGGFSTNDVAACGAYWQIPATAHRLEFILTGGGGGGAGGAYGATGAYAGGGGGGGAAVRTAVFSATDLGTPGSTYLSLGLGYGGRGGVSNDAGGSGSASNLYTGNYATLFMTAREASGGRLPVANNPNYGGVCADGGIAGLGGILVPSGGGYSDTTANAVTTLNSSTTVGGGAGGSITATTPSAYKSGGTGDYSLGFWPGTGAAGVNGVSSGTSNAGSNGSATGNQWAGGAGVGGGANSAASSTGGAGGSGARGSGGGGGGAGRAAGGVGGRGGDGYCAVRWW